MTLHPNSRTVAPGFGPEIPTCFKSLEEARNSHDYQMNGCMRTVADLDSISIRKIKLSPRDEAACIETYNKARKTHVHKLWQWACAFEEFLLQSSAAMDAKALQGATVLQLSHRLLSMAFNLDGRTILSEQGCWDEHTKDYEEMVNLAAAVVESQNAEAKNTNSSLRKPVFSIDVNIVTPLFSIASKCRDPHIRRKAISLLYSAPRQEGLWQSVLTGRVAERIMEIEEAGLENVTCCKDVPIPNRVCEMEVKFDLRERRAVLNYHRRYHFENNLVSELVEKPLCEVIEW